MDFPTVKLFFVVVVFPTFLNIFQVYWRAYLKFVMQDTIIKKKKFEEREDYEVMKEFYVRDSFEVQQEVLGRREC